MKQKKLRILCIILSAVLICGGATATVFAVTGQTRESDSAPREDAPAIGNTDASVPEKNETVYVIASADGSIKKLIVSDWLKNSLKEGSLADKSELQNPENVKGDESYSTGSDGAVIWDADGKDIYYRGNLDKELPVGMKITYLLDGKELSAAEIAGKSGKVTIRVEYENRQYETVEIDGEKQKIYVPFAMLTGVLLDNDVFTNVTVTNGKLINDGDRIAVVGLAFPGLSDNLALTDDRFEIPSYVEITADAKEFRLAGTVTVATNDLFNQLDPSVFDNLDELSGKLAELTDGVTKLVDGSSALYDGVCTLLEKSNELVAGINQLAEGAAKLKAGSADLATGAGQLSDGLGTLVSNNDRLNGGAASVFHTLLATATAQLAAGGLTDVPTLTIENYHDTLEAVIASLSEEGIRETARKNVTAQVEANRSLIAANVKNAVQAQVTEQVTASVRAGVEEKVLAAMGLTPEAYRAGIADGSITSARQAAVGSAVDNQMKSADVQALISANVTAVMEKEETSALIAEKTEEQIALLIEENMESDSVKAQIEETIKKAAPGLESLNTLVAGLDSYNEFYTGLKDYTNGVKDAATGAEQLKDGSLALDAGMQELLDGILTMKDGAPALITGVEQLRDGSMQLRDGLATLYEEGISKLTEALEGGLSVTVTRLRATIDVSRDYKSFSGIADGMDGKVKFIYRTDAVK